MPASCSLLRVKSVATALLFTSRLFELHLRGRGLLASLRELHREINPPPLGRRLLVRPLVVARRELDMYPVLFGKLTF